MTSMIDELLNEYSRPVIELELFYRAIETFPREDLCRLHNHMTSGFWTTLYFSFKDPDYLNKIAAVEDVLREYDKV